MAKHTLEKSIIITFSVFSVIFLVLLVPKGKIRQGLVSFLFHQVITWFFGLLVVEKGLISYPYRFYFKKSTKSSFIFEYLIFPGLAAIFNLYFPEEKNNLKKVLYYFANTAFITLFEIIALKYTDLIRYKNWAWYWSFITVWISYYLSHRFYRWFFKKRPLVDCSTSNVI